MGCSDRAMFINCEGQILFTTINIQSQATQTVSGPPHQYIQTKADGAKLETSQTNCFKQHTGKTSQTKRKEKLKSGNNRRTSHGSITLVASNLKPNKKLAVNWH